MPSRPMTYPNSSTALPGEVFSLLGPNGAGKTTTISMLCTILKPTSGTARVNGFDIVRQSKEVRKSIGIVFQDPSVDDRLTGLENLSMHANLYDVPRSEQKGRIARVLKLVDLEDRANDLLRTYSGGMRRRLEIARGLIHYPTVLFLDEPTIGLDPQTRGHIWDYIAARSSPCAAHMSPDGSRRPPISTPSPMGWMPCAPSSSAGPGHPSSPYP